MKQESFDAAIKLNASIIKAKNEIAARTRLIEKLAAGTESAPRYRVVIKDADPSNQYDIEHRMELTEDAFVKALKGEIKQLQSLLRKAENEFKNLR